MNDNEPKSQEIDVEIPRKWLQALKFAEMVRDRLDIPPAEMAMLIVSLSRGNESAAAFKSQE